MLCEMGNAISPGFELVSPCPIPATITITPRAPPPYFYMISIHHILLYDFVWLHKLLRNDMYSSVMGVFVYICFLFSYSSIEFLCHPKYYVVPEEFCLFFISLDTLSFYSWTLCFPFIIGIVSSPFFFFFFFFLATSKATCIKTTHYQGK